MAQRKPSTDLKSRYRKVKLPDGTTRDEHRHIMEQALGRKLGRYEVVHHKNGDPKDNRLENLEVMPLAEHSRHHFDAEVVRERNLRMGLRPPHTPGSKQANAKITEDEAAEVKAMIVAGTRVRDIESRTGVSKSTIVKIKRGESWKHVPWPQRQKEAA